MARSRAPRPGKSSPRSCRRPMSPRRASGRASGILTPCATARCAISTRTASGSAATEARSQSMVDIAAPVAAKTVSRFRFIMDRREVLGSVLVSPAVLYVLLLVGLPFLLAVYYSVSAYSIYNPSWRFVGLANFAQIVRNPEFLHTLVNSFLFSIRSPALGLVLGKFGAFLLLRPFPGSRIVRALIILPWAVPIALSTVAWQWMFDSLYSVINWSMIALGIITREDAPNWLGTPHLAMLCIIVVNAWRFFPFAIVIFLAGITSVPQDVIDAATVDGAGFWRRNYQIIMPMILPIVAIGLIFGIVFTFTDLSIVLLLTNGGPVGTTSVLGFEGYQVGIISGDVSHGAAISLFMLPVLFIVVVGMLRFIRRREISQCRLSPNPPAKSASMARSRFSS